MAMNGKGTLLDASTLPVKEFDGIIVGGGGSGMMASLQLAKSGMNTAYRPSMILSVPSGF